MKIVSFHKSLPISDPDSFLNLTAEAPQPKPRDLLVEVRAISVNPVDAKIRAGGGPGRPDGQLQILGWDAAGVVKAVGSNVTLFKPGDEVYYAGDVGRPGALLNEVARLVDAGQIRTTMRQNLGAINAANLKRAHALIESGTAIGKIVLAGF
jgi:NADPH:quinone reductase-like Zn-dependent oxidoreductase